MSLDSPLRLRPWNENVVVMSAPSIARRERFLRYVDETVIVSVRARQPAFLMAVRVWSPRKLRRTASNGGVPIAQPNLAAPAATKAATMIVIALLLTG
jgi:hypothetical protein